MSQPTSMATFQVAYFLRQQPWFAMLRLHEQQMALQNTTLRRVKRGEVALEAGEVPQGWHAVVSGALVLQLHAGRREVSSMGVIGPGDWHDEPELLRDAPRRYSAIARSDSEVLCMRRACFQRLIADNRDFQHAVTSCLAARLDKMTRIVEIERTGTTQQKLALHLTNAFPVSAKKTQVTQEEIGRLAGLSRQTVNRLLQDLEKAGLVQLRNGRVEQIDHRAIEACLRSSDLIDAMQTFPRRGATA